MTTEKLRWGLLSTARINRRIIPAIRQSRRGQVAAVASRSLAKAEEYAAKWEIPRTFGSYGAMLADADKMDRNECSQADKENRVGIQDSC